MLNVGYTGDGKRPLVRDVAQLNGFNELQSPCVWSLANPARILTLIL